MLGNKNITAGNSESFPVAACLENGSNNNKRKRRPAGTPDPDAEVVSLSPRTLLESDRYVCEICNQGFQRDQNLQMHRRRHKVPWKLLKRENPVVRKRVYVCPEPSCLHHDPTHALGDLVGIKKHFRRKHSNHKQWVCQKCSKAYAVHSDYKAHLKTCGSRGHSCDCGRVFSRVESFIEHQDACHIGRLRQEPPPPQLQPPTVACLSRTASSQSPSGDTNFSLMTANKPTIDQKKYANLELQLLTSSTSSNINNPLDDSNSAQLQLSIGSSDYSEKNESNVIITSSSSKRKEVSPAVLVPVGTGSSTNSTTNEKAGGKGGGGGVVVASRLKEEAREQLRLAMAEKAYAEEARNAAKRQIELAEQEFANAKRIRQQAQSEMEKAHALKEHAIKQINSTILRITCHACKQQFNNFIMQTPKGDISHSRTDPKIYFSET